MKNHVLDQDLSRAAKEEVETGPCTQPGHCPPDNPPAEPHHAIPPRQIRRIPPEAERRAFEDAVNGWWWL